MKIQNKIKQILWVGYGFLLSGCITTGKDFKNDLSWLRKSKTTKEDVKLVLGTPYAVGDSNGVEVWTYAFLKYQLIPNGFQHRELKLFWNAQNALGQYSYMSSFPEETRSK